MLKKPINDYQLVSIIQIGITQEENMYVSLTCEVSKECYLL